VNGHAPENNDPAGQGSQATCPGSAGVSVIPAGLARADDRKLQALRQCTVADLHGGEAAGAQ
jgi:hypothetical protein